jgi:hypothetical protein
MASTHMGMHAVMGKGDGCVMGFRVTTRRGYLEGGSDWLEKGLAVVFPTNY